MLQIANIIKNNNKYKVSGCFGICCHQSRRHNKNNKNRIPGRDAEPTFETLSDRERQVLNLIAQGYSFSVAAEKLGVTQNTEATQVKSIYGKLNISSRAEAAIAASKMGILDK